MFGKEGTGLRGRNVEDLAELEEQGLLTHRRDTSRDMSARLARPGYTNGHGNGSGMEKRRISPPRETRLQEHFDRPEKVVQEDFQEGLNNPRDRHAFALLVLLCELQQRV